MGPKGNHQWREQCYYCDLPRACVEAKQETSCAEHQAKVKEEAKAFAERVAGDDGEGEWTPAGSAKQLKKKKRAERKAAAREEKRKKQQGSASGAAEEPTPKPKAKASAKKKATIKEEAESSDDEGDDESMSNSGDSEGDSEEGLMSEEDIEALEEALAGPQPQRGNWSAADVVSHNAEDSEAAASRAELQKKLDNCLAGLQLGEGGADFIDCKALKVEKVTLEKALAKASQATPTPKVSAKQLLLDKEKYLQRNGNNKGFAEKGAAKARQTFAQIQLAQQAHINAWTAKMEATAKAQLERQSKWDSHHAMILQRHEEVLREYDGRIAAAEKLAAAVTQAGAPVAPVSVAVHPSADTADRFLTAAVQPNELPTPEAVKDDAKAASLQVLWGAIEALSTMPGDLPVSYVQMGTTAALAKDMLGAEIWVKYYPTKQVVDTDVVPKNLILRLSTQLSKIAEAYKNADANIATARKNIEEVFNLGACGKVKGKGAGKTSGPYAA